MSTQNSTHQKRTSKITNRTMEREEQNQTGNVLFFSPFMSAVISLLVIFQFIVSPIVILSVTGKGTLQFRIGYLCPFRA
jgi:hypothetical protein